MKITGQGDVFLADDAADIYLIDMEPGDALSINGANVLAFEPTLQYDIKFVQGMGMLSAAGLFNCVFTGQGRIAITSHGQPVVLTVDQPTYADPQAAICWSASLQTGLPPGRPARPRHAGRPHHRRGVHDVLQRAGFRRRCSPRRCAAGLGRPGAGQQCRRRRHARRSPRQLSQLRRSPARGAVVGSPSAAAPDADRGPARRRRRRSRRPRCPEAPGRRGLPAPSRPRARGYEPRKRTSAQTRRSPMQRLAHAGLGQMPGAVEEERVPPEPLAGRARLDPGEVDAPYRQLGQHGEQRADPVVGDVHGQRGDVVAGRRRWRSRARSTSAKRVIASGWSAMSLARMARRWRSAPIGAQMAASYAPPATPSAAAPLDSTSTTVAAGTWARNQPRHWVAACGWAAMVPTVSRAYAGAGGEHEVDRQHDLPGDHQRRAAGQLVQRHADRAADRVLQRHERRRRPRRRAPRRAPRARCGRRRPTPSGPSAAGAAPARRRFPPDRGTRTCAGSAPGSPRAMA